MALREATVLVMVYVIASEGSETVPNVRTRTIQSPNLIIPPNPTLRQLLHQLRAAEERAKRAKHENPSRLPCTLKDVHNSIT